MNRPLRLLVNARDVALNHICALDVITHTLIGHVGDSIYSRKAAKYARLAKECLIKHQESIQ